MEPRTAAALPYFNSCIFLYVHFSDSCNLYRSSKPVEGDGSAVGSSKPSGLQQFKKALYRTFQSAGMPLEEASTMSQDITDQSDETAGDEGIKWSTFPDPSHKFSSSHESLHVSMGEHLLEYSGWALNGMQQWALNGTQWLCVITLLETCSFQSVLLPFLSSEFADDTTKFFCKVYYAEEFQQLRGQIFPDGEDQWVGTKVKKTTN